MHSYTVTIGRNVNDVPMSDRHWSDFEAHVAADLLSEFTNLYRPEAGYELEVHRGKGSWQGVEEESSKLTLLSEFPLDDRALQSLRSKLTENARHYDQDAIALTIGESELC